MNGVNLKNNKNFLEGMRLFEEERKIPAEFVIETLKEAIDYFESSSWVKEVLGEEFCRQYVAAKKNEWLRYTRQVTDWEIAEYLYRL